MCIARWDLAALSLCVWDQRHVSVSPRQVLHWTQAQGLDRRFTCFIDAGRLAWACSNSTRSSTNATSCTFSDVNIRKEKTRNEKKEKEKTDYTSRQFNEKPSSRCKHTCIMHTYSENSITYAFMMLDISKGLQAWTHCFFVGVEKASHAHARMTNKNMSECLAWRTVHVVTDLRKRFAGLPGWDSDCWELVGQ